MGQAATVAGLALAGGLALGAKAAFGELQASAKVSAQTAAALKSTGSAAHVTAKQVAELAKEMLRKTGIDDEAIQSAENMLLTFRNVRNETGKGNDVFNQATKAALDMSVALGKDATQSSLMLGKALNDPAAGLGRLTRAGVQFTDAQKEQIKALQASGDTMGAQKIILAELTKEFGGSAEAAGKTLPGQLNVAELKDDGMSTRQIAGVLGVDHATVARDAKPVANATPDAVEASKARQPDDEPVANATPVDTLAALAVGEASPARRSRTSAPSCLRHCCRR